MDRNTETFEYSNVVIIIKFKQTYYTRIEEEYNVDNLIIIIIRRPGDVLFFTINFDTFFYIRIKNESCWRCPGTRCRQKTGTICSMDRNNIDQNVLYRVLCLLEGNIRAQNVHFCSLLQQHNHIIIQLTIEIG